MDNPEQSPLQNQLLCPSCYKPITEDEYFCPNCGKKLRDKPVSTSIAKQTLVYLVSFFLPPFGLPWAYKYLKQPDKTSKSIGYVVIGLTILSVIISIWLTLSFINQTNKLLNSDLNGSFNSIYSQ
ncbi:MAG TPA: zinc-ribbon domain-containing protein [Candidatus Saccharimonadales bacterium]|nr:zinc-ribbon domain-containing protein [Candidatus Saccharimonadales bacterium]